MFSLIVTLAPVHGPLGAAHNTLAVLATGSAPHVRSTPNAGDGKSSTSAISAAAR
jgi:hypothetical protein